MSDGKVRHLVSKPNADGGWRWYWQPSADLRKAGWRVVPLGNDMEIAAHKAEAINADVDAWRTRGKTSSGLRQKPPPKPPRPMGRPAAHGGSGVYIVDRFGAKGVKVGIAADIAGRLVQLQTGSPERLSLVFYWRCPHAVAARIEARLLEEFAASAIRGEWLSASAADVVNAAMGLIVASTQPKFDVKFDASPEFSACSRQEGGETLSGEGMVGALGLEPRTR